MAIISATVALGQPDIVIRDCKDDNGTIPSSANCPNRYFSPDIWTRLLPDGGLTYQQPVNGNPAYAYVRLTNIGRNMLGCGVVHLYYTQSNIGVADWPVRWINFYYGTAIRGDEIGSACVCCILPGQSSIVMIPWGRVPIPSTPGAHYCLLARFTSLEDPMQTPEVADVGVNVNYNNNIAQRNLIEIGIGNTIGAVDVFNGRADAVTAQLRFDARDDIGAGNIFDVPNFGITVRLGADLFALWQQGGSQGQEIEAKPNENAIVLKGPHATLDNISLAGRPCNDFLDYPVEADFNLPADAGGGVYNWSIEQYENGVADAVNGEMFEITLGDGAAPHAKTIRGSQPDLGMQLDLRAQPNLSTSSTKISYALPHDNRVTLAIYDAHGTLVRTLVTNADQTAGGHEIEWDGAGTGGTQVPSGTYFYRLTTSTGAVEHQLKIVR